MLWHGQEIDTDIKQKEKMMGAMRIKHGLDELMYKVNYIRKQKGFWISNFKKVTDEEIKILENQRPTTRVLAVHTMNGCNLSCKGCNHNSSLLGVKSGLDIDQLLIDLEEILPKIYVWSHVSIIGGEPLLEPRTEEVTRRTRELVENTGQPCDVKLFSNGSRLMQCKEWIVDEMLRGVDFRLTFHRSWYSTIGRRDWENAYDFILYCKDRGVDTDSRLEFSEAARYPNGDKREWFDILKYEITSDSVKYYPWNQGNPEQSFKHCTCPNANFYKGKMWKCSMIAYLRESLEASNQLDDPAWAKYLEYEPPEDLQQAVDEVTKPHWICEMCPSNPQWYTANVQLDPKLKRNV